MFAYDLRLALDSMKRHPGLSALMVLAIALGIAVCTVTFTIYHAMATNPIPDKSSQLYAVTLDTWSAERPYDDEKPDLPPQLLTYRDAMYLHGAKAAPRSVVMYKSGALLVPERNGVKPFNAQLRVTSHEFFPHVRRAVPVRPGLGRRGGRGPAARRRAEPRDEREGVRRREQRRPDDQARQGRVPRRRRAAAVGAQSQVLRPQQRLVRGSRGRLHPLRLGQGARTARVRQHQLLEARRRRDLPGLPELGMHLAAVLGRIADRRRSRQVPGLRRQLRAQPEGGGTHAAPAQQPALRRRAVARPQRSRAEGQPRADRHRAACSWACASSTSWACCSPSS